VFINIIRNAIEALDGPGRLQLRVDQQGRHAVAEIIDDGPGIGTDIAERIFDPCFTTKQRGAAGSTGGSGLGLSISARIVKEHGGTILATPGPAGGTCFTVTLPVADAEPEVGVDPAAGRSTFPPGVAVLVVDDEPDICEMIRTALSLRGAYVVVAGSGEEALDLCHREKFDAAFVDFSMSGLSGHDLGRAMVKAQPELPLVFMSGRRVEVDGNPHVADFLKKPFDLHEIQLKLREVLDSALAN
jgi:CheY-like chemotaxis protein